MKSFRFSKLLTKLTPPQLITLSFALMILTGTVLLTLPAASRSGESTGVLTALFTATSANCVTGLTVVNTAQHWSLFGKIVILILIQAGALGLITLLTLFMTLLHRKISLRERVLIQAAFNQAQIGGMVKFIRRIVHITLLIEGIGAVFMTIFFLTKTSMTFIQALGNGIFHSISAFCNAGFDILGTESLMPYQGNFLFTLLIMLLIVSGGLGFTVWIDLFQGAVKLIRDRRAPWLVRNHFLLHTKIVLLVTAILIFGGALLFLLLERNNAGTLAPLSFPQKLSAALFQSVTLRTAGFNTIAISELSEPSLLLSCLLMAIGGSPGSTAGGLKTVTLGVIMIAMYSVLQGRNRIEAFNRTLSQEILQKALTVTFTMFIVIMASAFLLYFTEQANAFPHSFMDLLFECSSAAGTVGLTTGITPYLSNAGKVIIIICMFLGRLSPVTVVVSLNIRLHKDTADLTYPQEDVIIG